MKAWLAFYVTENGERKSKTFSTRKLGMEVSCMAILISAQNAIFRKHDFRQLHFASRNKIRDVRLGNGMP